MGGIFVYSLVCFTPCGGGGVGGGVGGGGRVQSFGDYTLIMLIVLQGETGLQVRVVLQGETGLQVRVVLQVRVTEGDSGLCCCAFMTAFQR